VAATDWLDPVNEPAPAPEKMPGSGSGLKPTGDAGGYPTPPDSRTLAT
jgi:hypothetical protein